MSRYSDGEKLEAVLEVIEKGLSLKTAGNKIGACKSDVSKWVRLYREYGAEGLLMKTGSYDGQFKLNTIEYMHINHLSIRETAVKFGIPSPSTVGQWERIYYEEGRDALFRDNRGRKKKRNENKSVNIELDKKVEEDLIAENQRLRMEVSYLKKLNALVQERIQRENWKK